MTPEFEQIPIPPKLLTIGGSDSGGAAGVQADLKTWALLGMYGMSVLTVVTAQNSMAVTAVHPLPPAFVRTQLDAVFADYGQTGDGIVAVKTGFIGRVELIHAIANGLMGWHVPYLVVDPVLVNHRGESMFSPDVTEAYRTHLLPHAFLITPNWREAALLADLSPERMLQMGVRGIETAVSHLRSLTPHHILITGFPLDDQVMDIYANQHTITPLTTPKIPTENRHGSGDTLSAAICAFLAQGHDITTALQKARHFTNRALAAAAHWQLGQGHGPLAILPFLIR